MAVKRAPYGQVWCRILPCIVPLAISLLWTQAAQAGSVGMLDGFLRHTQEAFLGRLWMHALAGVLTLGIAFSGVDYFVRVVSQKKVCLPAWGTWALYTGYALPLIAGPLAFVITKVMEWDSHGASAASQAVILALTFTTILKWITGRPSPLHGRARNAPERLDYPEDAREFTWNPKFNITYISWPSGHTCCAVALAAAWTTSYPGHPWLAVGAYLFATGIGIGMVVGDHHWTSDMIAGAIMGQAIGMSTVLS